MGKTKNELLPRGRTGTENCLYVQHQPPRYLVPNEPQRSEKNKREKCKISERLAYVCVCVRRLNNIQYPSNVDSYGMEVRSLERRKRIETK